MLLSLRSWQSLLCVARVLCTHGQRECFCEVKDVEKIVELVLVTATSPVPSPSSSPSRPSAPPGLHRSRAVEDTASNTDCGPSVCEPLRFCPSAPACAQMSCHLDAHVVIIRQFAVSQFTRAHTDHLCVLLPCLFGHRHYQISRIRSFYTRKVKFTQQSYHDKLTAIIEQVRIGYKVVNVVWCVSLVLCLRHVDLIRCASTVSVSSLSRALPRCTCSANVLLWLRIALAGWYCIEHVRCRAVRWTDDNAHTYSHLPLSYRILHTTTRAWCSFPSLMTFTRSTRT